MKKGSGNFELIGKSHGKGNGKLIHKGKGNGNRNRTGKPQTANRKPIDARLQRRGSRFRAFAS